MKRSGAPTPGRFFVLFNYRGFLGSSGVVISILETTTKLLQSLQQLNGAHFIVEQFSLLGTLL